MDDFFTTSFSFKDEFDVLAFLRWHKKQKNGSYVRYKWDKMQYDGHFEINIIKVNITLGKCVMRIPYIETREVGAKELIGTTIECISKPW